MGKSRLLDAVRSVVDGVNRLADRARPRLLDELQLRKSASSIAANLRESNGRRTHGEKRVFLGYAQGSAEETDEHLRTNLAANRISERTYWRFHNRLVVIRKMIEGIIER